MNFNEDVRHLIDLAEAFSYEAEGRGKTGMRMVIRVEQISLQPDKWEATIEDMHGEVSTKYKGTFNEVMKKLLALGPNTEKTIRTRENKRD